MIFITVEIWGANKWIWNFAWGPWTFCIWFSLQLLVGFLLVSKYLFCDSVQHAWQYDFNMLVQWPLRGYLQDWHPYKCSAFSIPLLCKSSFKDEILIPTSIGWTISWFLFFLTPLILGPWIQYLLEEVALEPIRLNKIPLQVSHWRCPFRSYMLIF